MFIKNIWYPCAWDYEVKAGEVVGRVVTGEPIALWRNSSGEIQAIQDRCSHRHAPLSLGRIEGDEIRCMYHGLKFSSEGKCVHIPATDHRPPNIDVRVFPVAEAGNWIWVWPGEPAKADPSLIPDVWGIDPEKYVCKSGSINYEADYRLLTDNLTDLSHLDFVHENSLGAATGVKWSEDFPTVRKHDDRLTITRWYTDKQLDPNQEALFDIWSHYDFILPGMFIMKTLVYPAGAARAANFEAPAADSPVGRYEQQGITPTTEGKCRYLFASGSPVQTDGEGFADTEEMFEIVMHAFEEDRRMIEAQQRIWDLTPDDSPKAFLPQDKAPAMFRRMIDERLRAEQELATQ